MALSQISPPTALSSDQEAFVRRVSWGALLLGPFFYYLANGLVLRALGAFIPFYNIYLWIHGFFRGRTLAWQRGFWPSFEAFRHRQILIGRIGVGFVIFIIVVLGVLLFTIFQALKPMRVATDSFFDAAIGGNIEEAYKQTAGVLHENTSFEDFKAFVDENRETFIGAKRLTSWEFSDNQAWIEGTITTLSGRVIPVRIRLLQENGQWKVAGIFFAEKRVP